MRVPGSQRNFHGNPMNNFAGHPGESALHGDEEGSLYDTQYNEESILINKVNEMQIKTSMFN